MGTIIDFPATRFGIHANGRGGVSEPATIIILPVIRIERFEEPSGTANDGGAPAPGKKRRRTARR